MPSLTLSDRLIWFAHCPKAGGTSVEHFMVARWGDAVGHLHWGWDLWWRDGGWRVADPPNSPQHLIWEDALVRLERPPDAVFAVVRDPVARLTSEHRWQRRGRRGTWIGKFVATLPFSFWLRLMLAVVRSNPHAFDNHLRPQDDFIPATARVFHLEDGLDQVATWLTKTAGEGVPEESFPHALSTGASQPVVASDARRIAAAFAADYARFGYELSCHQHAPLSRDWLDWIAERIAPLVQILERRGWL